LISAAALSASVERFGLVNALAQTTNDYKALVCVFLNGGNDGNNTIIPYDDYNNPGGYNAVRSASGLAIAQSRLLQVTAASQNNRKFGLHPNLSPEVETPTTNGQPTMKGLMDVWNGGKLAVLCNVGTLTEPLTKSQYQSSPSKRPYQLFSHSDQVAQQQSSIANNPSQTGWGGRTSDAMNGINGSAPLPMVVSIAGTSLFTTGTLTRPLAIADSNTQLSSVLVLSMNGTNADIAARRAAYDQIRSFDNDSLMVKASSDTTQQALTTSAALSVNPSLTTVFPNTTLGRQLQQVARLIKLRDSLGMKRQIFFCSLGGFDTHSNQVTNNTSGQNALLTQLSQAMRAFYDATIELGVADNVTTFTLSDFGRTLQPAGSGSAVGSDHAWGNHALIMGGAVRGRDFYGAYPTVALGGPDDTDSGSTPRGRWIPTTSIDQYAATLASWYGLSSANTLAVFPFINRFASSNLGFML
jgi:uncharacterized protein (DUF1501 family)